MRYSNRLGRSRQTRPGLQAGPISKKMLRNTSSPHGRYTIYMVILVSFLGILLTEMLHVPYEITVLIISVVLLVGLFNMDRLIRWIKEQRNERFQEQLAERKKDRESP